MAPVGCVRCSSWWRFFLLIKLLNGVYSQSLVRLEDGWGYNTGRVEVFYNDQWNRICDDYFGLDEAQFVCRLLGYNINNIEVRGGDYYGTGTGPMLEMNCSDADSDLPDLLAHCSFTEIAYSYACGADAGVECGPNLTATPTLNPFKWPTTTTEVYKENDVRLVNGPSSREGRVEIYHDGEWNTICNNNWSVEEALVVCRQLGYGTANAEARTSAYYGQGSGPILEAHCFGVESSLDSCVLFSANGFRPCLHQQDAGVNCGLPATTTLDPFNWRTTTLDPFNWRTTTTDRRISNVRLVNGPSSREGRVEIYYNGQWNTICDDDWGLHEAEVVCRQLGYDIDNDTDNVVARSSAFYGQGSGPVRQVECYGWEYTLDSCTVTSGDDKCSHYEDAGVKCDFTRPTTSWIDGVMSFVGVSLFLLTIVAASGVLFVCKQKKPASPPVDMQELSSVTTTPSTAPKLTTSMATPLTHDVPV